MRPQSPAWTGGNPDTLDELAQFLASKGLKLVPYTSTGERRPDPKYMTLDMTELKELKAAQAHEEFRAMKRSWPQSPYIQAEGPSLQLERINITQEEEGCCCCKYWGPVTATDILLHYRPADPGMGSTLHKTYKHEGCGPVVMKAQPDTTSWEFVADDGDTLQFELETVGTGMCGCGPKILPNDGMIWTLRRGEEVLASIEVPPKPGCCDKGAKVWLRVKKGGRDAVFAIREVEPQGGLCCGCDPCAACDCALPFAECCDYMPCSHVCRDPCGCGPHGCAACCAHPECGPGGACACCGPWATACGCGQMGCRGGCCCNPRVCCPAPESIPVFADAAGIVSSSKSEGDTIKVHHGEALTHDIVRRGLPVPAVQSIPPQQVMIVVNLEGKAGAHERPGWEAHFGTHVDQAVDANKYYRLQEVVAREGQQVKEGELVAMLVEDKHCCGFPCLPPCLFCPDWGIGTCCLACCAAKCVSSCLGVVCPCCSCSENEDASKIRMEPSPVTGEWATPDGAPEYRVRGEVNSTKAVGAEGRNLLCEVVAGLESGTDADDHMAFALVLFMEMVLDSRRPPFHVQPEPAKSRGLPPRQQLMLTAAEVDNKEGE